MEKWHCWIWEERPKRCVCPYQCMRDIVVQDTTDLQSFTKYYQSTPAGAWHRHILVDKGVVLSPGLMGEKRLVSRISPLLPLVAPAHSHLLCHLGLPNAGEAVAESLLPSLFLCRTATAGTPMHETRPTRPKKAAKSQIRKEEASDSGGHRRANQRAAGANARAGKVRSRTWRLAPACGPG